MHRLLLISSLLFAILTSVEAQVTLSGAWEGTITIGGIHSKRALPMELYLIVKGRRIEGRSYVRTPDGELIRMDLEGDYYSDRSMSLREVRFAGDTINDYLPRFSRKYQLRWRADLWDSQVTGFWQEVTEKSFNNFRRRGRIELRKAKDGGV